jgi:protein TonB
MFDTILNPSSGVPRRRWSTTFVSAFGHAAIMIVLVLSTMYATDTLPDPPDGLTYVMVAPPPPPPPPPPAPVVKAPKPQPLAKPSPVRPPVVTQAPPAAAPVEAPDTIAPETGLEGGEFAAIDPGFEEGLPGGVVGGSGVITTPPTPPPAPVRIGGDIKAPRLVHRVEPEYPSIAVSAMIEGTVILEASVDPTGAVKEARVLRSHGILDQPALAAVEQWRYEPLMLNGKATPFVLTVTVSFSLGR